MLRASVTIATWNRRELLEKVVEALANQTIPPSEYEIIVCDSSSPDGTKESILALAARCNNVRYVNVTLNTLAVKRNAGIREAKADVIIFMDDDAIPDPDFVNSHVKAHEGRSGIVCCGQIRYPYEWIKRSNYYRYRDSRHLGPNRADVSQGHVPPWMITVMNLSFKRSEVVNKIGYVSEEFTRYGGEDVEFGFRIAASGMKLVYVPEALVLHYEYQGTIKKYYRKLYISSRDSAPILYKLAPRFLYATQGKYLERIYEEDGIYAIIFRFVARFCAHPCAVRMVITCLERVDSLHFLYFPFAYRYLTAVATVEGIRDRSRTSRSSQLERAWFE